MRRPCVWLLLSLVAAPVAAEDEGRVYVERALEAMGGAAALKPVTTAVLRIRAGAEVSERHSMRLRGRTLHYASRRRSGTGFDVVVSGAGGFLCDRNKKGVASYVEDLSATDLEEGAYERDVLFLPVLLGQLLHDPEARFEFRGLNSVGDPVVRVMLRPPPSAAGKPFVVRLRFDKDSHLITQAMGIVPCGADKGAKRYLTYADYRKVGELLLPARYTDERGERQQPRSYDVNWQLNVELGDALFARPQIATAPGRD